MTTLDRVHEKIVTARAFFVSDLETAVVKATKRNSKPPKPKHVATLIQATWRRDVSIADIGALLAQRLADSSWSVVFKALVVTHVLMDQGSSDRLIGFLATQTNVLNLAGFRDATGTRIEQGKNIQRYAAYLEEKVHVYRELKRDYCRGGAASGTTQGYVDAYGSHVAPAPAGDPVALLRAAPVSDVLLAELAALVRQLAVLLKAHIVREEIDNDVTLAAARMLVHDLLRLYPLVNEGLVNFLTHRHGLPHALARRGIAVFRSFHALAGGVETFLRTARALPALGIAVPELSPVPDIADALERELDPGAAPAPGGPARTSPAAAAAASAPLLDFFTPLAPAPPPLAAGTPPMFDPFASTAPAVRAFPPHPALPPAPPAPAPPAAPGSPPPSGAWAVPTFPPTQHLPPVPPAFPPTTQPGLPGAPTAAMRYYQAVPAPSSTNPFAAGVPANPFANPPQQTQPPPPPSSTTLLI